jgi:hypothetical protein
MINRISKAIVGGFASPVVEWMGDGITKLFAELAGYAHHEMPSDVRLSLRVLISAAIMGFLVWLIVGHTPQNTGERHDQGADL